MTPLQRAARIAGALFASTVLLLLALIVVGLFLAATVAIWSHLF